MSGQRVFRRLRSEVLSAAGGRFTVFHLAGVAAGLGTTCAVAFGWSVPRFGAAGGPLVGLVSGIAAYWLTLVAAYALGGGLLGVALYLGWYEPARDEPPDPPGRPGGPA